MNMAGIKNRIKKLEPKQVGKNIFAEICENDTRAYDVNKPVRCAVYAYTDGLCYCCTTDYVESIQTAFEKIKKDIRKYTSETANIYHTTNETKEYVLKTLYLLDGVNIKEKYPQQKNEVIKENYCFGAGMSDTEWLSSFRMV